MTKLNWLIGPKYFPPNNQNLNTETKKFITLVGRKTIDIRRWNFFIC